MRSLVLELELRAQPLQPPTTRAEQRRLVEARNVRLEERLRRQLLQQARHLGVVARVARVVLELGQVGQAQRHRARDQQEGEVEILDPVLRPPALWFVDRLVLAKATFVSRS